METLTTIAAEIQTDPKLMLMTEAIANLSEKLIIHELALKTIQTILIDQNNSIKILKNSLQEMGEAFNVLINQISIVSRHPSVPAAFKGITIK